MIPSQIELREALVKKQGEEVVAKLEKATVAICGCGGLGSNIAVNLARAGVGKLILIDFDCVDITNLQRQQYKANQVGLPKAETLAQNLKEIAPYVEIETHVARIGEDNAISLVGEADVVCEAFDDAEAKALLTNMVLEFNGEQLAEKQKYLVAASGMAGFGSANDIKTRRVTKRFYLCGDGVNDVDKCFGLLAPRVMACAAHQALTVIRLICGMEE